MKHLLLLPIIAILLLNCSTEHKHQEAPFDGAKVKVDVNLLKNGIPVFYYFIDGEYVIHFFILRTGEDIGAYFDACKECYQSKLGFRYEDNNVICNACNVGHSIYKLKEGIGGCHPIKLKGKLTGNIFEIDSDIISKGKIYF